MSTIYWDESSRGYHSNTGRTPYVRGRWVGEKTENGKRVRMRSTNYEKILAWVQQWTVKNRNICSKGTPMIGMPQYSVDIEQKEVYNQYGKTLKGDVRHGRIVFHLVHKKVRHHISWERIAYAVLHNINVLKIPTDIIVTEYNGEYILQHAGDYQIINQQRRRQQRLERIDHILNNRKRELDMLQRYYKTGDSTEIVTYSTKDIFDNLLTAVMKINHCGIERATDIVTEATEIFLQRITTGDLPTISISATIKAICRQCTSASYRKRKYNDNIITKK